MRDLFTDVTWQQLENSVSMWSEAAKADLIEASLRKELEKIEDQRGSHDPCLWEQMIEHYMEEHRDRVGRIELLFFQKRTGEIF